MEIKTKYNFGDIVYFTEETTIYEARIKGFKVLENMSNDICYILEIFENIANQYESCLFTSAEEAKQSIIDSIFVMNL